MLTSLYNLHPLGVLPGSFGTVCRSAEQSVQAELNKYTKHLSSFKIKKCQILRESKQSNKPKPQQSVRGPFDFCGAKMSGSEDNGQKTRGKIREFVCQSHHSAAQAAMTDMPNSEIVSSQWNSFQ